LCFVCRAAYLLTDTNNGAGDEKMSEQTDTSAGKITALRAELAAQGVDGLLVPMADEYQNEYVPARAQRIAWLTGFEGSAGLVVVLPERAACFTDGRYTLQIAQQVDASIYELRHISEEPPTDWIAENLGDGGRLGYDPWLFTPDSVKRFSAAAAKAGGELVPLVDNPVDKVWRDQPDAPLSPVLPHPLPYAGEPAEEKRMRLAADLKQSDHKAAVITASDSIAWLLNIRGGDVQRSPLPLSLALLRDNGHCDLFLDDRKIGDGLEAHLGNQVTLRTPDQFGPALDDLSGARVRVDPGLTAAWVFQRLDAAGADIVRAADPCQLPKAIKNDTELAGARAAHLRDGAAVSKFLHWLSNNAVRGGVDEIGAADKLESYRRENELFRDLSFDTISGSGPNGAIVHYRVSPESNRELKQGELYLVDSGAQYLDGTTDITRTVAIGTPSEEMRDRFTRVLKGHIAVATSRFPKGTTGAQIDPLARVALWQAGLDFDHGTGHGVGSYLNVHEGPQRISKLGSAQAFLPGMVVSNEPGYYKTGAFGIRIENLVCVRDADVADGEREVMEFETLTRAPIDRMLVDVSMLTPDERAWLDGYHARVYEDLSGLVDDVTREWLDEVTRPLD
jgi:Xaa-Pro aminopeptidase